jgi:DNA-binding response OmpR family regulator
MIKLLILDDDPGTCNHLAKFFRSKGYTVLTATRGEDAISIIESQKPQILFLDIQMEGINGLDVLKKAKEDNPGVKVVMITAIDDNTVKRQAEELGASEYIRKPFSFDMLETLIIRLVNEVLKLEDNKKT